MRPFVRSEHTAMGSTSSSCGLAGQPDHVVGIWREDADSVVVAISHDDFITRVNAQAVRKEEREEGTFFGS